MKKYYTKILTECPNILIRKFKIRENVNNIGESIGTAQNHIFNRIGGESANQSAILKPKKVSFAHREACDLIVVGSSQNHRGNFDSKYARVRHSFNSNYHTIVSS